MFGLKILNQKLQVILSKKSRNYVTKDEFFKLANYLLINQLNSQTSLESGVQSNRCLRDLFLSLLPTLNPTVFCDIGSRDSESAARVKQLLPECECFAFEANPKIYERFEEQVKTHYPQIHYLNLAIGDANQSIKIFSPKFSSKAVIDDEVVECLVVEPEDTGRTSLLRRNEEASYDEFEVQCYTLDHFLTSKKIDLNKQRLALWIDVEGAADKVLTGAQEALKQSAIVFIEVEGHEFWQQQKRCHEVSQALLKLGFIPIARDREYYDKQFNLLFLHRNHIEIIYPSLFDLKSNLSSLKGIGNLQVLQQQLQTLRAEFEVNQYSSSIQSLQERVEFIEGFLDEYIQDEINENYEEQSAASIQSIASEQQVLIPSVFVNSHVRCDIPIYIPCFNNFTYLKNMLEQLQKLNCWNIVVLDNVSTYPPLLDYLQQIEGMVTVIRLAKNEGPRFIVANASFYQSLPPYFCITDPDLEFNSNLPTNFIHQLIDLTEEFKIGKAGISLDISDRENLLEDFFWINGENYKIWEWEAQFWQRPLRQDIYHADIDTTFAVYNKRFLYNPHKGGIDFFNAIRVAGNFTGKHLPWYRESYLSFEEEEFYRKTNQHSYYFKGVAPHQDKQEK